MKKRRRGRPRRPGRTVRKCFKMDSTIAERMRATAKFLGCSQVSVLEHSLAKTCLP